MMASINETDKVKITIKETSLKNCPIRPSKKKKVEKAIMVVNTDEMVEGTTSKVPSMAA